MSDHNAPVTEDELHRYVDDELATDRREAVKAWLASHADDAARVAAWQAQADSLRARYGAIVGERIPPRLSLDRLVRRRRSFAGIAAAAAVVAFAVGGLAGWVARGAAATAPTAFEVLTKDAVSAHQVYVAEVRHPIEVAAGEDHLLPWLSRRVGVTIRAPDLGTFGLKLLGGRLLPGPIGPAALFMYEGGTGERFTFYCARLNEPQSAFRYAANARFASVRWIDNDLGCVLSGIADRDRLGKMAETAYDQLENRAPQKGAAADQLISRRGS